MKIKHVMCFSSIVVIVIAVFLTGSKYALDKYYERTFLKIRDNKVFYLQRIYKHLIEISDGEKNLSDCFSVTLKHLYDTNQISRNLFPESAFTLKMDQFSKKSINTEQLLMIYADIANNGVVTMEILCNGTIVDHWFEQRIALP